MSAPLLISCHAGQEDVPASRGGVTLAPADHAARGAGPVSRDLAHLGAVRLAGRAGAPVVRCRVTALETTGGGAEVACCAEERRCDSGPWLFGGNQVDDRVACAPGWELHADLSLAVLLHPNVLSYRSLSDLAPDCALLLLA